MIVNKSKTDPVKTCLVIAVGFLIVYFVGLYYKEVRWDWALYVAAGVGFLGALSNYTAEKVDWLWMKLAWILSLIVPNIILSIVFFVILTPIALLSRVFGEKNQLSLKNKQDTMFKEHKKDFSPASFKKTW